nr:hypothetical protein [Streptomyces ferrugineus]
MVDAIAYDFSRFDGAKSLLGANPRTLRFDAWIAGFLRQHPSGTVVEIGTGISTRFERLDNGTVHWRHMLAASVTDPAWIDEARRNWTTGTRASSWPTPAPPPLARPRGRPAQPGVSPHAAHRVGTARSGLLNPGRPAVRRSVDQKQRPAGAAVRRLRRSTRPAANQVVAKRNLADSPVSIRSRGPAAGAGRGHPAGSGPGARSPLTR